MIQKIKYGLQNNQENTLSSADYAQTLSELKQQVQKAQLKSIISANRELIKLYWSIGKTIAQQQAISGWGSSVIECLARDLQNSFPGIEGFSRRNVFRMRALYLAYEKVPQAVAQIEELPIFRIPWGHNVILLEKVKLTNERLWYAQKAIEHGWSRSMLEIWIKSDLYRREGNAVTNFEKTLPHVQSEMAQQTFKDPYLFDFLALHEDSLEKDLEDGLVSHMQKFLLELGDGFAFIGRKYPLVVAESSYYIDLLFYHVKLRCYVVIELKATSFKPEFVGQINFYLSAVDDLLRQPQDQPTIGILLCKTKNKVVAEYALRGLEKPIGVSEYQTLMTKALPEDLKSKLPTVKEIEEELEKKELQYHENKS